jgi:hypothetical protein
MVENKYHVKFSPNLINNLNNKETSPEFINGERKKKKCSALKNTVYSKVHDPQASVVSLERPLHITSQ